MYINKQNTLDRAQYAHDLGGEVCRTHKWTHRMQPARNIYGYATSLTQPLMRTRDVYS